jgi:two-component system, OmpR family, response regulator
MRLLLIEDDKANQRFLERSLSENGYQVDVASTSKAAEQLALGGEHDALILDLGLPDEDGLSLITRLKQQGVSAPVLILSARRSVDDRVRGLEQGGDDYLTKPFALIELVARIEALLRRPMESRETTLRVGSLELDLIERTAKRGDRVIDLLPREFRLLEYMMQRSDQLLTRAMLLEEVWKYKFVPATNLVDVHMGRLRHKVDGPDEVPMIHNVRGSGFILRIGP